MGNRIAELLDDRRFRAFFVVLYAVAVFFVSAHHEQWFDEAQAWLLARDFPLGYLLRHELRYEGHPPLWYLILKGWMALGLGYEQLWVLPPLLAIPGIAFLVFRSPFPAPIRYLVPLGFFLFFQYAVVARPYVLLPLLFGCLAETYPRRKIQPGRYAMVHSLLALTHLLCGFFSAIAMSIFALEVFRDRRQSPRRGFQAQAKALLVFGCVCIGLLGMLWLPGDETSAKRAWVGWWRVWLEFKDHLSNAFSLPLILVPAVLGVSAWVFSRARVAMLFFLPLATLLGFMLFKHGRFWHDGILFLIWLSACWICFRVLDPARYGRPRRVLAATLIAVAGTDAYWGLDSAVKDFRFVYSGASAAAAFVRSQGLDQEPLYCVGSACRTLLPYFSRNIFVNVNGGHLPAAHHWGPKHEEWTRLEDVLPHRPMWIMASTKTLGALDLLSLPGYRRVATFMAMQMRRGRGEESESYAFFRKET